MMLRLLHVWIRIHKAPEYGSNTDPDPQHYIQDLQKLLIIFGPVHYCIGGAGKN